LADGGAKRDFVSRRNLPSLNDRIRTILRHLRQVVDPHLDAEPNRSTAHEAGRAWRECTIDTAVIVHWFVI
jgi:hypothetical protein